MTKILCVHASNIISDIRDLTKEILALSCKLGAVEEVMLIIFLSCTTNTNWTQAVKIMPKSMFVQRTISTLAGWLAGLKTIELYPDMFLFTGRNRFFAKDTSISRSRIS